MAQTVSLNKEVQQLCDVYVQHIGPQFGSHLPLTLDLVLFRNRQLCRRLPDFWTKWKVGPDLRVATTNIPKWIVTIVHQKKADGLDVNEVTLRKAQKWLKGKQVQSIRWKKKEL